MKSALELGISKSTKRGRGGGVNVISSKKEKDFALCSQYQTYFEGKSRVWRQSVSIGLQEKSGSCDTNVIVMVTKAPRIVSVNL